MSILAEVRDQINRALRVLQGVDDMSLCLWVAHTRYDKSVSDISRQCNCTVEETTIRLARVRCRLEEVVER